MKIGTLGGLGYLLLIIISIIYLVAPAAMGLEAAIGVFIISLVGLIMIALAWYMLGGRLEDGLMKLFGILVIGWIMLVAVMVGGLAAMYVGGMVGIPVFLILWFLVPIMLILVI